MLDTGDADRKTLRGDMVSGYNPHRHRRPHVHVFNLPRQYPRLCLRRRPCDGSSVKEREIAKIPRRVGWLVLEAATSV
jgi:hypothetical protein